MIQHSFDNGLTLNGQQAIIWTNDYQVLAYSDVRTLVPEAGISGRDE